MFLFKHLLGNSKVNNRPNVNSILHLFGGWLFEAAFIGNEDLISNNNKPMPDGSDTKSEKSIEVPPSLTPGKYFTAQTLMRSAMTSTPTATPSVMSL